MQRPHFEVAEFDDVPRLVHGKPVRVRQLAHAFAVRVDAKFDERQRLGVGIFLEVAAGQRNRRVRGEVDASAAVAVRPVPMAQMGS